MLWKLLEQSHVIREVKLVFLHLKLAYRVNELLTHLLVEENTSLRLVVRHL